MSSFGFLILIVAFVFLWLVLVRPQKRRQVEQQRMLADLHVGDEVLTAGGVFGTITRLDESELQLEIAPGLEVRVARRAVAGVTPRPDEGAEEQEGDEPGEAPETAGEAADAGVAEAPTGEKHG